MVWLLIVSCIERAPVEPLAEPPAPPAAQPPSEPQPEPSYSLCACCTWGVTGIDPGPDYQPPPLPEACKEMLEESRASCVLCPVPD
jgi:hypothetical protein